MLTDEEPPMGRFDGKPSVDQMFAGVGSPAPTASAPAPTPAAPPVPPPPTPNSAPTLVMTEKANGVTLEQYLATPGWTEELLIEQGLAIRPSFS